jgi:NADP-dependent 3-hydroxy acid dehydrogenase YdfG
MIDINIKGVLYGIAAALPVFRKQGFGHFVNTASTAGHKTVPNQSVYSATKFAGRARQVCAAARGDRSRHRVRD